MRQCEWCNLSEEEKQWLLHETQQWSVYLADEQDYVGRCILVLNRHCGSLSELQASEWAELKEIIDKLEYVYKMVLGAELCNWSCLMNSFYKKAESTPHLHFHVRPRYKKPLTINHHDYTDTEFGHHYKPKKEVLLTAEDKSALFELMKSSLNK